MKCSNKITRLRSALLQRGLACLSCMLMLFCTAGMIAVCAQEDSYKSFTAESAFSIDASTGLITGYAGADTTVVVPSVIQGVNVTGISTAFTDNSTLQTLIVPDTMQIWGDGVFSGCTALNTVATYTPISADYLAAETAAGTYFSKSSRIEELTASGANYYHIQYAQRMRGAANRFKQPWRPCFPQNHICGRLCRACGKHCV